MAKGDHKRSENKSDEQQKLAQGYLTGTQQNIGNQYGANNSLYWGGGGAPQYGNTYGWGTTVPNYNQYGSSPFKNNGTDVPMYSAGGGTSANGGQNYQQMFDSLFPGSTLSSQDLSSHEAQLNQMGFRLLGPNAAGMRSKIELPNGQIVDLIHGAGAGGGTGAKQWMVDNGGGGGGGIGMYGSGGIPGMSLNDYAGLQGMYGNALGDLRGLYGSFLGSASNMANTGGLSEADKANLRSRAISPIRSVYSQGLQNVERQRALQGGYSPGFTTAMGRFNRQMGQQTSDATTNAEAAIAELVQKGKLGGLSAWGGGLSGLGSAESGLLGGMGNLYGTQPGLARLYGDQLQNQMSNQLQAAQLQNQLGLGLIGAQNYIGANVPGNTQGTLQNIMLGGQIAGGIGGMMSGMGGIGGGGYGAANGQYGAVKNYGQYL